MVKRIRSRVNRRNDLWRDVAMAKKAENPRKALLALAERRGYKPGLGEPYLASMGDSGMTKKTMPDGHRVEMVDYGTRPYRVESFRNGVWGRWDAHFFTADDAIQIYPFGFRIA